MAKRGRRNVPEDDVQKEANMTQENEVDIRLIVRRIVVRPGDVSRPYGVDNPDFGTILVDDLKIRFVCGATRYSPVRRECYPITPCLADPFETEAEQAVLDRYGIVFEPGKLCVIPAPTGSCPVLSAVVGMAVSSPPLEGSGGQGSYTFSASGLPVGLSMGPDGTISGTPTGSGDFGYTVTVIDSDGNTGTFDCRITVLPAPTTGCPVIDSVVGETVSSPALVGSGGVGKPYTFSASGWPAGLGLSMAVDGTISGTPTRSGVFPYSITVKDAASNTGTLECSITVLTAPTACCPAIKPVLGANVTSVPLVGGGGAGEPYTFSARGLPPGLSMGADGTVSGTPTQSGTFRYSVTIIDSRKHRGVFDCCTTVLPAPTISCPVISAVLGARISSGALVGSGGAGGPYTFTASGLPPGLSMAADGTISGAPSVSGTFSYSITIADSAGNTSKVRCSVTVPSAHTAHIERAKQALNAAIARYESPGAESERQALSNLIESGSRLRELEQHVAAPQKHGFVLSFPPDVTFPLPPGGSARVKVFKPGESEPIAVLDADSKTGDVHFPANEGEVYDFEALLDEFPIQRITLKAS